MPRQQAPELTNDFRCTLIIRDDIRKNVAHLREAWIAAFEQLFADLRIGQDRSEGLVQFMRKRARQFAEERRARQVYQLGVPGVTSASAFLRRWACMPRATIVPDWRSSIAIDTSIAVRCSSHSEGARNRISASGGSRPGSIRKRRISLQSTIGRMTRGGDLR